MAAMRSLCAVRRGIPTMHTRSLTRWRGEVKGDSFAMDFILGVPDNASEEATISFPDGVQDMPLEILHNNGDKLLRFSLPAFKAKFETTLQDDGNATGTWRMGQQELHMAMQKISGDEVLKGAARPQHPIAPFPYDSEEVIVNSGSDGCLLAGTLTLPRNVSSAPAVLLLTGSGPRDRDHLVFGHKPFLVLADALTQRGCAVLRVDDRGVGSSAKGSLETSVDTYAQDALSCLDFLRNHSRVDSARVGVLGHSEGAVAAAVAAATSAETCPAFMVLLASPGLSGRETLVAQNRAFFTGIGAQPSVIELVIERLNTVMDRVQAGATVDEYLTEAKALLEMQHYATGAKITSLSEEAVRESVAQFTLPGMQRMLALDPCEHLARARCRVLALGGSKDSQIISDVHLPKIEAAVRSAGMPIEIETLQDLNHLFQRAETGMVTEYAELQETINPKVLTRIGDWVLDSASE